MNTTILIFDLPADGAEPNFTIKSATEGLDLLVGPPQGAGKDIRIVTCDGGGSSVVYSDAFAVTVRRR